MTTFKRPFPCYISQVHGQEAQCLKLTSDERSREVCEDLETPLTLYCSTAAFHLSARAVRLVAAHEGKRMHVQPAAECASGKDVGQVSGHHTCVTRRRGRTINHPEEAKPTTGAQLMLSISAEI